MTTAYDVPSKDLIGALAKKLQSDKAIVPPEWANFARTGVDRENPPMEKDWWHTRCASILRKIYINNCIQFIQWSKCNIDCNIGVLHRH